MVGWCKSDECLLGSFVSDCGCSWGTSVGTSCSVSAASASLATAASAASHSSSSTHGWPVKLGTVLLFVRRWTSRVVRWTRWARASSAWSTFSRWSVSSVHHALGLSHWLASHWWPAVLEVAWGTSLVSGGWVALVVGFASSSFRIHHSLSILGSAGSWAVPTVAGSAVVVGVAVWWHGIVSWAARVHEEGWPVSGSLVIV